MEDDTDDVQMDAVWIRERPGTTLDKAVRGTIVPGKVVLGGVDKDSVSCSL